MTDMLIPNRPPKGKNIDEILANLPKEGEVQPEVPPAATAGFSIEDYGDFYRLPWVDFCKECDIRVSYDAHVALTRNISQDVFGMASAPTVYRICKELYENKEHPGFRECIHRAKIDLSALLDEMIFTLSGIKWMSIMQGASGLLDYVHHNIEKPRLLILPCHVTGPSGLITDTSTYASEYLRMVLNTQDSPEKVNEVFKWVTGLDTKILRWGSSTGDQVDENIIMGIDKVPPNKYMCIASSANKTVIRNILLVRYRQTK